MTSRTAPAAVISGLFNRAIPLHQAGRLSEAAAIYGQVLTLDPGNFDALHLLGVIHVDAGRTQQGADLIRRAIASDPGVAPAYSNLGKALNDLRRYGEALSACDAAIRLGPNFADAHNNRGLALYVLGRAEEALASFERAIALAPKLAQAHRNRGMALHAIGRPQDALASYDAALKLDPNSPANHYSRGVVLDELLRFEESVTAYDRAIALKPDFAGALWNRSHKLLQLGRFEAGLRDYEWRKSEWDPKNRNFAPDRLWSGAADVRGKTVFVYSEQGLGDTLQFCRYVTLLRDRGAEPILTVQRPLRSLLQQLTPATPLLDEGAQPPHFDYHCPMLSLPLAFGTRLETIPAPSRYLQAEAGRRTRFEGVLGPRTRPRIGLAWSGNPTHRVSYDRSIPLDRLQPLFGGDVEWICLQKEVRSGDAETLRRIGHVRFLGAALEDFSDTAALLDLTDLVITIDTSVAHLAGAMGKPMWVLLPGNADWRWFLDRSDSPWYPSARLFRQRKLGDWTDVIDAVAAELAAWPFTP
jgi:Flp pilus assembly protein TadD